MKDNTDDILKDLNLSSDESETIDSLMPSLAEDKKQYSFSKEEKHRLRNYAKALAMLENADKVNNGHYIMADTLLKTRGGIKE